MAEPLIEQPEVIRIQGIHKAFNTHQVLAGIDFSLRFCETVSVLGGSGSVIGIAVLVVDYLLTQLFFLL